MGFIMVSVTILGATALSEAASRLELSVSRTTVATGLVIFFTLALTMQGVAAHPSPYYYQSNNQVTESAMDGYSVALEHRDQETAFVTPRGGQRRYVDAYYGRPTSREEIDFPGYSSEVRGEILNTNISTYYDSNRYLPIREANYQSEVVLYDGLRYTNDGFESLETEPKIYRVQDNGGFTLYMIRNEE
jgi:hypothetical protein